MISNEFNGPFFLTTYFVKIHSSSVLQDETGGPWEMRSAYKILVGEPEWKRPLGRPMSSWEDDKWILKKCGVTLWAGFNLLSVSSSG
jgi:hypothetical protein